MGGFHEVYGSGGLEFRRVGAHEVFEEAEDFDVVVQQLHLCRPPRVPLLLFVRDWRLLFAVLILVRGWCFKLFLRPGRSVARPLFQFTFFEQLRCGSPCGLFVSEINTFLHSRCTSIARPVFHSFFCVSV